MRPKVKKIIPREMFQQFEKGFFEKLDDLDTLNIEPIGN